ncbi:hypothetical protein KP509_15G014900 [Ceratopteris richardii]|uniref:histidinol-phosphatase n=1 Tax=Ceratopteris richardii TaxID=49495 RepID=A0A8T2T5I6_CERRI|nr:hypothetical protein KP509_15G014900 [Ceratopteris richardii]
MEACLGTGMHGSYTPGSTCKNAYIAVPYGHSRNALFGAHDCRLSAPLSVAKKASTNIFTHLKDGKRSFALFAAAEALGEKTASPSVDEFLELAHQLADVAGDILRKHFRQRIEIKDKEDKSPVTIADQEAEEAMRLLISKQFPSHAVFGEEWGLTSKMDYFEYVWVLDPIDGTKSFITGKPVFGTLISLVFKGVPIIGIIDQPILHERWVGVKGRKSLLNGKEIETRPCTSISNAYMYTTSPHLFSGAAAEAFLRIKDKVKVPLYGCDCYAFGLLASGFVDLAIESGVKPYDFLALIPVVEGAGGKFTDWKGQKVEWWPSGDDIAQGTDVIAAGDVRVHEAALEVLGFHQ